MLLTMMAMAIQLAVPAGDPQIEIPDSALRDPHGFVQLHCGPLVRSSGEALEACEYRVGTALRTRLPSFRPRRRIDWEAMLTSPVEPPPQSATPRADPGPACTFAAGDEACRRQARNRLAIARASQATEAPEASGGAAPPENCRMVMRRSEDGFGGSLSRVCGDEAESGAALDRLRDAMRPAVEPCDRPASLETQEAWIARCRALPPR